MCLEAIKGTAIVGQKILSDQKTAQKARDDFVKDKRDRERNVDLDQFGHCQEADVCRLYP